MKKKPYYLKQYKEWIKTGQLPQTGLCFALDYNAQHFQIFEGERGGYWGFNGDTIFSDRITESAKILGVTPDDIRFQFTPFRQTIVLFLAAMNNEL